MLLTYRIFQIDDTSFDKLHAVFALRSIPEDDSTYPSEILKAAANAHTVMCLLQNRNECNQCKYFSISEPN